MSMVKTVAETRLSKGAHFARARGTEISCKGWQQEAALRMLMNNLDPEGGGEAGRIGGVRRNRKKRHEIGNVFHAIVKIAARGWRMTKRFWCNRERPVGIFRTHEYAPRVLLCNSNLVGHWNNWDKFHEYDRAGLMMYGQMTAGSWIYIGTQGILQGTYETFAAAAKENILAGI